MTKEEFREHWNSNYPETVLISHYFRHDYPDRWFRIHSLPKSKRYASSDEELKILLTRQNEIITDLLGVDTSVLLVTGDWETGSATHFTEQEEVVKNYSFTLLDNIDLHKLDADNYDKGQIYRPAFAEILWKSNQHDSLLKEIANDNLRAFFVSFAKNVIVAPYDGGVDFVLRDNVTKEFYRNKYKQWLSALESGL